MKVNYHTHTPLCRHALGENAAEYAKAAYEAGLEILGFSDHAPFEDRDFGYRMLYSELELYLNEIECLKKEYASRMKILTALEIEYLPEYTKDNNYYEWLLNEKKLDYLLLGEHFYRDSNNELFNIYNIDSETQILEYAKACCRAMETGYFKILAHPDLFGVNSYKWSSIQDEACDMIIQSAIKNDVIIEFNANGYRRGIKEYPDGDRYMYPLEKFWNKVAKANARVIVSADAHNPKEIWDYALEKAYDYLYSIGITPIETF